MPLKKSRNYVNNLEKTDLSEIVLDFERNALSYLESSTNR